MEFQLSTADYKAFEAIIGISVAILIDVFVEI